MELLYHRVLLVKAYNGIDAITIMKTKKDIKKHAYDKLKGNKNDKVRKDKLEAAVNTRVLP